MSSGTAWRLRHACLILAVVMLALVAAACDDDNRVSGSGAIVTESRQVEGFDEIVVSEFGRVEVEVTGTETLEVEADDNLLPLLTSSVSDGRLRLGVKPNTRLDPSSDVVYRVTAAELGALTVRGSGSVTASGIDADELTVTIAGAGSITLAGRAQSVDLRIPGAGTIDAAELVASAGSVQINGAGDVTVNATDTLDIAINGSGNVSYLGSPALDQGINGSGKVSRVEAGSSAWARVGPVEHRIRGHAALELAENYRDPHRVPCRFGASRALIRLAQDSRGMEGSLMSTPVQESALDLRGKSITTFVVNEIASQLESCETGQAVDVLVDDGEALDRDLRAWSAATGHGLRGGGRTAAGRQYSILKGVPREPDHALAMVISNPGLFELLSPLGFALAASLEGIAVRIYFQAQAVRVLESGFTPRARGLARPFSRFALRGLERTGHVHPQEKLRQLDQRGAEFYLCRPSMDHFKVAKEDLIFPDVKIAAYFTFMSVMVESDIHVFVQ